MSDTSSDGEVEKTDERSNSTKPLHIPGARIGFACPECYFTGKSSGIVHSHMVDVHKLQKLVCGYCKFSTKNSTSFYNHTTRYCRKITEERKDEQVKDIKSKHKTNTCANTERFRPEVQMYQMQIYCREHWCSL